MHNSLKSINHNLININNIWKLISYDVIVHQGFRIGIPNVCRECRCQQLLLYKHLSPEAGRARVLRNSLTIVFNEVTCFFNREMCFLLECLSFIKACIFLFWRTILFFIDLGVVSYWWSWIMWRAMFDVTVVLLSAGVSALISEFARSNSSSWQCLSSANNILSFMCTVFFCRFLTKKIIFINVNMKFRSLLSRLNWFLDCSTIS